MQDKNDINAMAKKYKEEMMLAYSKKRIGGNPPGMVSQSSGKEEREHIPAPSPKIKQIEEEAVRRSRKEEKKSDPVPVMPKTEVSAPDPGKRPEKDLNHPPMPKIPSMEKMEAGAAEDNVAETPEKKHDHPPMPVIPKMESVDSGESSCTEKDQSCPSMPEISHTDNTVDKPEKWKFLTAEELIKKDAEAGQDISSDTSSDIADESHHQGNYDFTAAPDKEYEKEVEVFKSENGAGYLQVEVICGEDGCPIEGAAIAVTRQVDDMDTLVYTLVTGSSGSTDTVTLPATGEKYMITVYKDGFFTVRDLDVPIFDTIKSIQPVTMTEIGKKS